MHALLAACYLHATIKVLLSISYIRLSSAVICRRIRKRCRSGRWPKHGCAKLAECRLEKAVMVLATKRRGLVRQLDFANYLAKCIVMVINALEQIYCCRAGRLQIGR